MQADLVRASCHELDTDEVKGKAMGRCRYKRLIVRLDGKRPRFRARGIAHLISFVILDELPVQDPRRRRLPVNESLIHFRESARLDERIHFL